MSKKILIIEDDEFLRALIVRKLIKEGFEAIEADDGEEGIIKAKTEKLDLILLDLVLPKMDGFDVLERIKKDPISAKVPVIILTNLDQKDNVKKTNGLVVDYLIKANLDPVEITERIKKALK